MNFSHSTKNVYLRRSKAQFRQLLFSQCLGLGRPTQLPFNTTPDRKPTKADKERSGRKSALWLHIVGTQSCTLRGRYNRPIRRRTPCAESTSFSGLFRVKIVPIPQKSSPPELTGFTGSFWPGGESNVEHIRSEIFGAS